MGNGGYERLMEAEEGGDTNIWIQKLGKTVIKRTRNSIRSPQARSQWVGWAGNGTMEKVFCAWSLSQVTKTG